MKKVKIIYILSDNYDKDDMDLYENVIGFVNEPFDVENFIKKIKSVLDK